MSNPFKSVSRFADLSQDQGYNKKDKLDEITVENKTNYFKDSKKNDFNRPRGNNRFGETFAERYNRERDEQLKEQQKEKERLELEALHINSFPELSVKKSTETKCEGTYSSYMDKLQTFEEIKDITIDPDLATLKPGWVLYKKDSTTGKTIIKQKDNIKNEQTNIEKNDEHTIDTEILNALIELHQLKTDEYIAHNGYEEWEIRHKCSDWREFDAAIEELDSMYDSMDEDDTLEYIE